MKTDPYTTDVPLGTKIKRDDAVTVLGDIVKLIDQLAAEAFQSKRGPTGKASNDLFMLKWDERSVVLRAVSHHIQRLERETVLAESAPGLFCPKCGQTRDTQSYCKRCDDLAKAKGGPEP